MKKTISRLLALCFFALIASIIGNSGMTASAANGWIDAGNGWQYYDNDVYRPSYQVREGLWKFGFNNLRIRKVNSEGVIREYYQNNEFECICKGTDARGVGGELGPGNDNWDGIKKVVKIKEIKKNNNNTIKIEIDFDLDDTPFMYKGTKAGWQDINCSGVIVNPRNVTLNVYLRRSGSNFGDSAKQVSLDGTKTDIENKNNPWFSKTVQAGSNKISFTVPPLVVDNNKPYLFNKFNDDKNLISNNQMITTCDEKEGRKCKETMDNDLDVAAHIHYKEIYALYDELPKNKVTIIPMDIDTKTAIDEDICKESTAEVYKNKKIEGQEEAQWYKAYPSLFSVSVKPPNCSSAYTPVKGTYSTPKITKEDTPSKKIVKDVATNTPYVSGSNSKVTWNKVTSDKTVYAWYKKKQYNVTVYPKDKNTPNPKSSIPESFCKPSVTTVGHGDTARVTAPDCGANYRVSSPTFSTGSNGGSPITNTSSSKSPYLSGARLIYKNVTSNQDVYAWYERATTLTLIPIDFYTGQTISSCNTKTQKVFYGETASLTAESCRGYNMYPGTYSTALFKTPNGTVINNVATGNPYASGLTVTQKNMTANTTIYVYYYRSLFEGRARVFRGGSTNGDPAASTGFSSSDLMASNSMDCANDGCQATYDFHLRTVSGIDKTHFSLSFPGPYYKTSPYKPSENESGDLIGDITEKLYPGQYKCHNMIFTPISTENTKTTVMSCMKANVSYFKGKSTVTHGNNSVTTDWKNTNTSRTYNMYNCTNGCKVSFKHEMNRENGELATTTWLLERTSNLSMTTRGINKGTIEYGTLKVKTSIVGPNNNPELTLYPGMVVCERLTFKPSNDSTIPVENVYTEACASAYGNAQPEDPDPDIKEHPDQASGDQSFINIKVRNSSVSEYNLYQRSVYAKPKDDLIYRSTYNPVLQYTYYLKAKKMKITAQKTNGNGTISSSIYPSQNSVNTNCMLGSPPLRTDTERCNLGDTSLYNHYKGVDYAIKTLGLSSWNNDYSVYSNNGFRPTGSSLPLNYHVPLGVMTDTPKTNSHKVQANNAGRSLDETATTNPPINISSTVHTTPGQVTFSSINNMNTGDVNTVPRSRTASAIVPYNYYNETFLSTCNMQDMSRYGQSCPSSSIERTMYSGESVDINLKTITRPRNNNVTKGEYATIVKDARIKLVFCIDSECDNNNYGRESAISEKDLNANTINYANYHGNANNPDSTGIQFNVPDISAGSKMCIKSAVYPKDSYDDTNIRVDAYPISNPDSWAYSSPNCFTIAKRPNIQVWGGSAYVDGDITTSQTIKKNIAGYGSYDSRSNASIKGVFGSWTELGLIANGTVRGFGSGASMGYSSITPEGIFVPNPKVNPTDSNNPSNTPNPGGSTSNSFCAHSPLTYSNSACENNRSTGQLGNTSISKAITESMDEIISKMVYGRSGEVIEPDGIAVLGTGQPYYFSEGNLGVSSADISKSVTQVVHSEQDVTVFGDIKYTDSYSKFSEMPKIIIYAEGNINISCEVGRIDGVLIAGGSVNTCAEADPENEEDSKRSIKQLVINGAVLANSLSTPRTYGAATGSNSIIPAEIINFNPNLYRWGNEAVDEGDSSAIIDRALNFEITHQKEMAPRY